MPFTVDCPACGESLDVDEEYRTWKVRCPHCRHEFRAEPPAAEGPRPRRRSRRDDDEYDDEEDDEEDDEYVLKRARRIVSGPSSCLRIMGILGIVAGVGGLVLAVAMGMHIAKNPAQAKRDFNAPNEEDLVVNVVVIGVASLMSIPFGALIAYGAVKMGRLESHGWAMTSAVLSITSILYCTCCLVTGVPLGIWAIVAMNNPDVRAAFAITARQRRRPGDDYE